MKNLRKLIFINLFFTIACFGQTIQVSKPAKLLVASVDNIDSAILAEKYFYYSNGNDSLIKNYEHSSGITNWNFEPSGKLIGGELLSDDTASMIISIVWLTNDSIIYNRLNVRLNYNEKILAKLINPSLNLWDSDSIIWRDSTGIITQIHSNKFDQYDNLIENLVLFSSSLDSNITTYQNIYDLNNLVAFVENSGEGIKYYFVEYNTYDFARVLNNKNIDLLRKMEDLNNFNIKGQKTKTLGKWNINIQK